MAASKGMAEKMAEYERFYTPDYSSDPTKTPPSPFPRFRAAETVQFERPVQQTSRANNLPPPVSRPREICTFSFDEEHKYQPDERSLVQYVAPGRLPVNLSEGLGSFRKLADQATGIGFNYLLKTIRDHEVETDPASSGLLATDFIMWRGMGTKIMMASAYENTQFCVDIYRVGNTIYLHENPLFHIYEYLIQEAELQNRPFDSSEMTFWGYKFETLATTPLGRAEPSLDPDTGKDRREEEVVSNHSGFVSVVQYQVGPNRVILGGEVDCIDPEEEIEEAEADAAGRRRRYVELKTALMPRCKSYGFCRKLFTTWAQCFLLGIDTAVFGYRDGGGNLLEVEKIPRDGLLHRLDQHQQNWNRRTALHQANGALHFLSAVLSFIKRNVKDNEVWTMVSDKGVQLHRLGHLKPADFLQGEHIEYVREGMCTRAESQPQSESESEAHQSTDELELRILTQKLERGYKRRRAERQSQSQSQSESQSQSQSQSQDWRQEWARGGGNYRPRAVGIYRPRPMQPAGVPGGPNMRVYRDNSEWRDRSVEYRSRGPQRQPSRGRRSVWGDR